MTVKLAQWTEDLDVTVAASLYSLPVSDRISGAIAAANKGYWIHADVILTEDGQGGLFNRGVDVDTIHEVRCRLPQAKMDVHLMASEVCRLGGWQQRVRRAVAPLLDIDADRWSASAELLELIRDELPSRSEFWTEYWFARDGASPQAPTSGVLAMLIEPGTAQQPGGQALSALESLAVNRPVGIDGGVNPEVAVRAREAGVTYMVIGRALFDSDCEQG